MGVQMTELSAKQQAFVDLYILNLNASDKKSNTQIAIDAGYNENSAYSQASRLLSKDKIKQAIELKFSENSMSANEVLKHLADIARGDIQGVDINNRLKALDLMAKHHNLTNKMDVTSGGEPIILQTGMDINEL
jgi:phage terminase small subunit